MFRRLTANLLIISFAFVAPAYAGGKHEPPPSVRPEPVNVTPANVSDDGSNRNALAIAVVIAAGVCLYHKCWQPKPEKVTGSSVPENPQNEYITIKQ